MAFLQRARAAFLASLCVVLAACSAGVSAPPATPEPGTIAISPSTATLFSELPTSFVISGGTAPYFVTSSNQATVPVVGSVTGSTFTVVPNPVGADTSVTLTVRDSANSPPASANLTVRPRTISNVVTVTPSAGQSPACGNSVCAGGDAEVSVQLSQAGVPLAGRSVRFDVVSGEFRIIADTAVSETLVTSSTTSTDGTGTARIRVRVLNNATAQTGLLQVTDLSSGFSQRIGVPIAPLVTVALGAQPTAIDFTGPNASSCAGNNVSAEVLISGGRPPYQITRPPNFSIDILETGATGARFRITPSGVCVTSQVIAIADSLGATTSVTVSNQPGQASTAVIATPATVTLNSCTQSAQVSVAGGRPPYTVARGADTLVIQPLNAYNGDPNFVGLFQISRQAGTTATTPSVQVGFTDGQSTATVEVIIAGNATTC